MKCGEDGAVAREGAEYQHKVDWFIWEEVHVLVCFYNLRKQFFKGLQRRGGDMKFKQKKAHMGKSFNIQHYLVCSQEPIQQISILEILILLHL